MYKTSTNMSHTGDTDSVPESGSADQRRVRALTEKGAVLYESMKGKHLAVIQTAWKDVELLLDISGSLPTNIENTEQSRLNLEKTYDTFLSMCSDYINFLGRTNTDQSQKDYETLTAISEARKLLVLNTLSQLTSHMRHISQTLSRASKSSKSPSKKSSCMSDISSTLARKKAKAEAAKGKAVFAIKEAKLKKEQAAVVEQQQLLIAQTARKQAELQADLDCLKSHGIAAETAAEVQVFQSIESGSQIEDISVPKEDPLDRTRRFVEKHSSIYTTNQQEATNHNIDNSNHTEHFNFVDETTTTPLNVQAAPYKPRDPVAPVGTNNDPGSHVTHELTNFLLRKELLLTRLSSFNDQPETYLSWKSGFLSVILEVGVSAADELDLLIRWLGPASVKQAHSLKAANPFNPTRALHLLWDRLDERYGALEMVESSLKAQLERFPKLTNKDTQQLYELSDLLTQIESLKEDSRFSTLLAYYDSSSGVLPIARKLTYSLQEKWTSRAAEYKRKHKVPFPPFSVFVSFLKEVSHTKNGPSFAYDLPAVTSISRKETSKGTNQRMNVSTKKTETLPQYKTENEALSVCPLHKTKHSLNDCRGFRSKSIQERKELLKQHKVCFRCCSSIHHTAKACKETIVCTICQSNRHPTALHFDRQLDNSSQMSRQSGDVDLNVSRAVNSSCTQVCGKLFNGKSCSKTVLVDVYSKSNPQCVKRMYAILDEQSNSTLARSEFFDIFNEHGQSAPYTISSCNGTMQKYGRSARDYVVTPLDNSCHVGISSTVECDMIPDSRTEIPTPEVAQAHPHLSSIMQLIPAIDEKANILLLIGRDTPDAHHVLDQITGPRNAPYAQRLPLGWVIVGETCLGTTHRPNYAVNKTHVLNNGRPSFFIPCDRQLNVKASQLFPNSQDRFTKEDSFGLNVFDTSKDDNKRGFSMEDRSFLHIMEKNVFRDEATRDLPYADISNNTWLCGPATFMPIKQESYPLSEPDGDKEVRQVTTLMSSTCSASLGSSRFLRFSSWKRLVGAMARLKHVAQAFQSTSTCRGWHVCSKSRSVQLFNDTETLIIKELQADGFAKEIHSLQLNKPISRQSSIISLTPYLDEDGVLRVGGRLNKSSLDLQGRNPIIIPGKHQVATLLIRHFHERVHHQGRHITEGAVRSAGYWVTGCKRLISSMCHKCVKCRKLRAKTSHQLMADLPRERLSPAPPFTYVGVDTFGPFSVVTRKTRGGAANSKRWGIVFSCLASRAIHLEVAEEISSSAFINALRRFIAIRGKVKQFRSDRGTNFIGATKELNISTINVEDAPVKNFLFNNQVEWVFNPPHSSHMGGSWEGMIGVIRRILDSMLMDVAAKNLTHDVLITLFAEVCAIVNSRPIVPVSSDPECPFVLSPSMLLTQKADHSVEPLGSFDLRDMYSKQWKRVQTLADVFWRRWRREYLQILQQRRKWRENQPNVKEGDIILLKDKDVNRAEWCTGVVEKTIPGEDQRVRKGIVRIYKDGKVISYTRPISEMVILLTE